jgi:hypothetical protein
VLTLVASLKVPIHRNEENLHLRSRGDLQRTPAQELLNMLKLYANRTSRIFVHTNCLRSLNPSRLHLIRNNLAILKATSLEIVFTGNHACRSGQESPIRGNTISTMPSMETYLSDSSMKYGTAWKNTRRTAKQQRDALLVSVILVASCKKRIMGGRQPLVSRLVPGRRAG